MHEAHALLLRAVGVIASDSCTVAVLQVLLHETHALLLGLGQWVIRSLVQDLGLVPGITSGGP